MTAIATFALTVLLSLAAVPVEAQTDWEVGLRFGDDVSVDATVPFGPAPRLHAAVYLDRFGLGAYFNWVFQLRDGPPNLKFYAGGGPELFLEHETDLAAAGDLGVEWAFEFPLTVGFDWRPSLRLTNDSDFYTGNWGITARFRLGEGLFEPAD